MAQNNRHLETSYLDKRAWLRALVLGADDGVISIAALLMSLLFAQVSPATLWISGISAILAGGLSIGIGEYVSVSAQKDTEQAAIEIERVRLEQDPQNELNELVLIYIDKGLSRDLAVQVAKELSQKDGLAAHISDDLKIVEEAQPFQAAYVSCVAFIVGGGLPFLVAIFTNTLFEHKTIPIISTGIATIASLAFLGYSTAKMSHAPITKSLRRLLVGGIAALIITSLLGMVLA